MVIVPSILEKTSAELFSQIKRLTPYYSHFQIDIADGIFVLNKTVQIEEISQQITNYHPPVGGPISNISFEFHLMVKDYEKEMVKLKKLKKTINIKTVLIHLKTIQQFNNEAMKQFKIGVVLNPQDSVQTLQKSFNVNDFPIIQIMSINPGFQGQPFLPETLTKIEQLRHYYYRNKISLDGAVNDQTIPIILSQKYQPDILCPGSFLTRAENLEERINYLKAKVVGLSGDF